MRGRGTQKGHRGTQRRCARAAAAFALLPLLLVFTSHRAAQAAPADRPATVVSMNLRDVPASKAYAELARQAGVEFTFTPKPLGELPKGEPRLSVRVIQEPFWAAVDQLNRQSGLVIEDVARQPAPRVTFRRPEKPGTFGELQTFVAGAFHATLLDRTAFAAPPASKHARPTRRELGVQLHAEPKLRPLFWHSMQVEELVDAAGRHVPHVVLLNASAPRMVPFYAGPAYMALRVDGPADALHLGRFTVTGKVMAAPRSEVAEVAGLDTPSPRPGFASGFQVEAAFVTNHRGRLLRVSLTRTGDDGPTWLKPASRMYVLQPVVLDAKGRRVHAPPIEFRTAGRSCHMLLKLGLPAPPTGVPAEATGEPHRLLLDIPTDVVDYDVRLRFNDVTLK